MDTFTGFNEHDFNTFNIEGLDDRMAALKERIQPKFRAIGEVLTDDLASIVGNEMYLHIAKHARRTKNPPKDTWLAIAGNKRGYKQHPHFQVGLWEDNVFIWLAYIYEAPNKETIAKNFIDNVDSLKSIIPNDFMLSKDHMKNEALPMNEENLMQTLERFKDVKKGEFLVGRRIDSSDPILKDGSAFIKLARETFETLIPIYKMSIV